MHYHAGRSLISETRRRLKEWGTWARDAEPSLGSMFKAMWGARGAQDLRELPPHIAEVDHLICASPREIRAILIKFYGQSGTYYEKAVSLGLDKRTFKRRIDRADYYIHSQLDALPQQSIHSRSTGASVPKRLPSGIAAKFLRHITT